MEATHRLDVLLLLVILAAYLGLGVLYGLAVPPFENLDEKEHFSVIRCVADRWELPTQGNPEMAEPSRARERPKSAELQYNAWSRNVSNSCLATEHNHSRFLRLASEYEWAGVPGVGPDGGAVRRQ